MNVCLCVVCLCGCLVKFLIYVILEYFYCSHTWCRNFCWWLLFMLMDLKAIYKNVSVFVGWNLCAQTQLTRCGSIFPSFLYSLFQSSIIHVNYAPFDVSVLYGALSSYWNIFRLEQKIVQIFFKSKLKYIY